MARRHVSLKVGGHQTINQWPGVWTYWTHLDDLQMGEWVVVEAPHTKEQVPLLAQVVDINPPRQQRNRAAKWIIDRINWDQYNARKALAPNGPDELIKEKTNAP